MKLLELIRERIDKAKADPTVEQHAVLRASIHEAVSNKNVAELVAALSDPVAPSFLKMSAAEWVQGQIKLLSAESPQVFRNAAGFWTQVLDVVVSGKSEDSFYKTPKKPLPEADRKGSRELDRKSVMQGLDEHMRKHSPLIPEGAARSIEKARSKRKKNPLPAESIELDMQRKRAWKERKLKQPSHNLGVAELRKRLRAVGIDPKRASKKQLAEMYDAVPVVTRLRGLTDERASASPPRAPPSAAPKGPSGLDLFLILDCVF